MTEIMKRKGSSRQLPPGSRVEIPKNIFGKNPLRGVIVGPDDPEFHPGYSIVQLDEPLSYMDSTGPQVLNRIRELNMLIRSETPETK